MKHVRAQGIQHDCLQPAATFVNYVCTIQITQQFRQLDKPLTVIFWPENRPMITGVAHCHKKFGRHWNTVFDILVCLDADSNVLGCEDVNLYIVTDVSEVHAAFLFRVQ